MSVIATAVKHLLAAGVTGDALLSAIAEMEAQVRAEPKTRSAGATRTQLWRENKRLDASQTVTCDESDVCDAGDVCDAPVALSLPPNENNSNPPTHTHPDKPSRTRKAHRLPADWVPAPLTDELDAALASWPVDAVDRELAKFRDWAKAAPASSGSKSDWDATWRNWLRRAEDEGRYRNGSNRNNAGSAPPRHAGRPRDGAIAELDRQLGLDGFGEPLGRWDAGGGPGSGGRALARARPL